MLRLSTYTRALLVLMLAACAGNEQAPAADSASLARTPDGVPYAYERIPLDTTRPATAVIDSVFPMEEMIRRFREGLPETRVLDGGAASRQELATQFVAALAKKDEPTLGRLTLSRAEFAWIFFPNTPNATRDNGLPPTLLWSQTVLASEKGISRALDRIGGGALTLDHLDCPNVPITQGAIRLHSGCVVRLTKADGSKFNGRLFGAMVEHAGRFKFAGYSNDM